MARRHQVDEVIAALLSEPSQEAAARKVGISRRTLCRWLRDERFLARMREVREGLFAQALMRLTAAASPAVATLLRNLEVGDPVPEIRAATSLLHSALRGVELGDLFDRVEALEQQRQAG